ncbi:MAG: hypothetical protein ACI8RD_008677 [Bacillariaceae sp.]|jgi:hypothetical protein
MTNDDDDDDDDDDDEPVDNNDDDDDDDEVMEQYRVMAIMEANFRVKDNTGFDMAEYKQRRVLLEEQRRQEQLQRQQRAKPKPKLPEIKPFTMWNDSSSGGINGSSSRRPEEPPLPFTRANRRFCQNARTRTSSSRQQVPEISPGIVVTTTTPATSTALPNHREHVVKCWGCSNALCVNVLATLVQCPDCLTVSPVTESMSKT